MNKLILSTAILSLLFASSCQKDPVPNPDGTFPECTELSGTQTSALILTNHVTDPSVPDYCISGTFFIHADVTVEPGVYIQMKNGSRIHVRNGGSFYCVGASNGKITIKGENNTDAGQWGNIHFATPSTDNQLIHTNISGGGDASTYDAMVFIGHQGYGLIENCYISSSSTNGIKTESVNSTLAGISFCTISACALNPINVSSRQVEVIAPSVIGGGNGSDNIEVRTHQLQSPAEWNYSIFGYHIDGVFSLSADLIVPAGANFFFAPGSRMEVTSNASLNCIGTSSQPITFRGDTDVPGSWGGIVFISSTSLENRFDYCDFSYGGSGSNYIGMVTLWTPSNLHASNSNFSNSSGWGVYNHNSTSTFTNESSNTWTNNANGDFN